MRLGRVVLLFFSILQLTRISAQGLPPVENFSPVDYQAENQNWAVSQSADRLIYTANNQGLLEYNGADWTLYPSPNETIMRSVKAVGDRIYTGCYMEFGYWQKDQYGILRYTSLSDELNIALKPDEEFWNILKIDNFLLFQSLKRIYIYNLNDAKVNIIDSETSIPKIFNIAQSVYHQKIGEGIYKIENGIERLLFNDEVVRNDEVVAIFSNREDISLLTRSRGLYKANGTSLGKINTPADEVLSGVNIYSAMELQDGSIALGTIAHGLILLDPDWNVLSRIDEIKGLRNNTVLSMFEDQDSGLWLGLDNGISYVDLKSPYRAFSDSRGIVGSVYSAAVAYDMMYLGTNQGLFYRNMESEEDFKLLEGTKGQVWSLDLIGETLFCGHHIGTYIIEGNKAKKIASIPGTWKINSLDDNPDLLLQGNYDGLHILEKIGNTWVHRNKIYGFEHSARFFELFDEDIFVNHEYKGIFKVEIDPDFTEVIQVSQDTSLIGANSGLIRYKGELLYSYRDGIFKYDRKSKGFVKDSLLSTAYTPEDYLSGKLSIDYLTGDLWLFTSSGISYFSEGSLETTPKIGRIYLNQKARSTVVGYESVVGLNENRQYLFGTSSGFITADLDALEIPDFQITIGRVFQIDRHNKGNKELIVDPAYQGVFKNDENFLKISYYSPQFNRYNATEYQHQLVGIYDNWSAWSTDSSVSYENLPYGEYEFKVRSKIGYQVSENTATYKFLIEKPWYISNEMLALYVLGIIVASIAIHRSYRQYYHNKQMRLIEMNQKELDLVHLQNEKEIIELKNKQLKKDFRNKSNELAASTMSLIKKNELLSQVKDQLSSSTDETISPKEIIRIIDRNLDQKDDWELFKQAFNNADIEFLKKLENKHPNLSPNDIRLCAYLRLNLVTKEIAQLLNISPRSVEIKRYRLRKKLNLQHDENLVNYILKL